jgi:xanthine dehydrogenase accessory factor
MLDTNDPNEIERFTARAPCMLVRVEQAKGSTPRIAGTQMLVSAQSVLGTIGGGQLEFLAIDAAREMLAAGQTKRVLSIPLGPEIGQCCGGHVTLLSSKVNQQTLETLREEAQAAKARQPSIYIFGAGHVGRALATAFLPLPVNALLIDTREDELALSNDAVTKDCTPLPEAHIRSAPAGSAFVMLTHDHALDFLLAREALGRVDAAYIGMIGSKTKRATFASWLDDETGSRAALSRLTMPIGACGLTDKRPAVIAAMVAAEVMEVVGTHKRAMEPI